MLTAKARQADHRVPFKINIRKATLYFLFYWPALFLLLQSLFIATPANWKGAAEAALFTSVLLLIANFLRFYWLRLVYLLFVLLFVYLVVFIKVAYFYLYKNPISESTVFIVLETNAAEARDFISMYFDQQLALLSLALLVPLAAAVFFVVKYLSLCPYLLLPAIGNQPVAKKPLGWTLLLVVLLSGLLLGTSLRKQNIVYIVINSMKAYRTEANAVQLLGNDKFGGKFSNVRSDNQEEELYVVVIGESTTRDHMSLYNYYRDTNPLLSSKKSGLDIFTNVISPHTHTIAALQKVLTLANFEHPERYKDGSLLQLMNKAGFATYWVSNQSPIGTDETLVTKIAKAAGQTYFTNTASWRSASPYDEKLFIPFKQVLAADAKKKFVIVHLMGAHAKFNKRYPSRFEQFRDAPTTAFKNEKSFKYINQYDNAVLYNDYVVNSLIELVKKQNKKSWLLYFSDHGEDVYETINMTSHLESNGTKPMYDIPFFIWRSDKYKLTDNHEYTTNRKYMTDDLIYTVSDMSHVHFAEFDSTRSLVNPKFVERKRGISKTEDYDSKFLKD